MLKTIILLFFLLISNISKHCWARIAPKIAIIHLKEQQNYGAKLKIPCFVSEGNGPFVFEWQKNGQSIFSNRSDRYRIDSSEDSSSLTIFALNQFDSGNYTCLARNEFGSDSQTNSIAVKGLSCSFFSLIFIFFISWFFAFRSLDSLQLSNPL